MGRPARSSVHAFVIDNATMTGVVDRLERSGLVERRADIDDRRIYHLFDTCRGPQLDSAMDKLNDEVTGLLGQNAPRFHRMLRNVATGTRVATACLRTRPDISTASI
jgi:MarR family transcriptional regulator, organic hydroperoxide resistance regulator